MISVVGPLPTTMETWVDVQVHQVQPVWVSMWAFGANQQMGALSLSASQINMKTK